MSDWILNKSEKSNSLSSQDQNLFSYNNAFGLLFSQILKNVWESFSSHNINESVLVRCSKKQTRKTFFFQSVQNILI